VHVLFDEEGVGRRASIAIVEVWVVGCEEGVLGCWVAGAGCEDVDGWAFGAFRRAVRGWCGWSGTFVGSEVVVEFKRLSS
jgi:hypothetical protein